MTRRYDSPLRAEQAEHTRGRIVEALAAELGTGNADFSLRRVAARAGVSLRTVHHHFPTRDEQLDAVARHVDEVVLGGEPGPADAADLPAYVERVFRAGLAHEGVTRTLVTPGVAERVRARRRRGRLDRIDAAVAGLGLDVARARLLGATLKVVASADFALALLDQGGLDPEAATAAARATVVALLAAARDDVPTPAGASGG